MQIQECNVLSWKKGVICHQVNCQGVMGSGLAKSIKETWPEVFKHYTNFTDCYKKDERWRILGESLVVTVGPDLKVANIFGQLEYGYDGKRYTDYCALNRAFKQLRANASLEGMTFYFPYNFGCDRGGADWKIVSKMIDFYFGDDVIICKLP